ncbi:hypothetical protein GCM10010503_45150 [Streptomyces lucensis JCM 4490]|uniref:Carrier domain-containing protein n=1 Tax=Streptomyces lucensis JCM 4490 TaxID=1306176 RepID=A0A918JBG5_9ACTN|nr:alpha/beta fold hydrolase [Streptomyces lucensis]GGW63073.1 hypothetical protein GCM10010503_45150 [Streptomyces lucensis JCM 4490]
MTDFIESHPLSAQQAHVWRLIQDGAQAYAQAVFEVDGPLDGTRLRAAAESVTLRHGALRTHYDQPPSQASPTAVVQRQPSLLWETEDLSHLSADRQRPAVEEVARRARDGASRTGPGAGRSAWWGTHCVLAPGRHAIVVTTSLLTADSRAFEVLLRDLVHAYEAQPQPEVLQLGQFVQWQRELADEELEAVADADALWERRARTTQPVPARPGLPGDPGDGDDTVAGSLPALPLDRAVVAAAASLADRCGVRPEAVFLAAWHLLLWELTGSGSTTVATAFPGRAYDELEDCLGHLVRWVGVRARAQGADTFEQVVSGVGQELSAVEEVEDCLVDSYARSDPPRWTAAFECKRGPVHETGATTWRVVEDTAESVRYDVKLECLLGPTTAGIVVRTPGRFASVDLRTVAERYGAVLRQVLADPGARLRRGDRTGREEVGPARQQEPRQGAAEPCDAVEAAVVGIYEELLGVGPVGVDDDFFHLGGHSLLAVQLIARVGALFHLELPVSVLFDAAHDDASEGATPRHLAGVVRNTPAGTGLDGNSPASRPRNSLVALRRGGGPALFCIPPAGGDVTGFRDLVRTLSGGFAVYGLQHPAVDGVQEPSVERLAATCLDEIRRVLPRGPFHVLGWSMGGLVAFEVAARLSTLGEDMAAVTLVESYPAECLPAYDTFGIVTGVAEELDRLAGRPVVSGLNELREKPVDAGIDALFRQAETSGVLLTEQEKKALLQQLTLLRAHVSAAQEYRLGSYDGPVTLIQAADEESGLRERSAQLWQRASRGRFERHTLPGGHFSLMREPHVHAVSRLLQKSQESAVLPAENVRTGDARR